MDRLKNNGVKHRCFDWDCVLQSYFRKYFCKKRVCRPRVSLYLAFSLALSLMGAFEQFNALFICLIPWAHITHSNGSIMDDKYNEYNINFYSLFMFID